MTHTADIPTEARVRHTLDQYLNECQDNGKRPSVLTLAARLGLTNTTFRRHFPELAKQISVRRANPQPQTTAERRSSPYDILVARNAKLRRANRALTDSLQLAAAQVQRLGIEMPAFGKPWKPAATSPESARLAEPELLSVHFRSPGIAVEIPREEAH